MTDRNHAARFCQNNQAATSGAVVSVSSYLTDFPASNAVDPRRWKRWITTGAFRITSSNCNLYISDGSNKTITLTQATYTTGALLAAHIQTQLNASSSNWTCTYSSSTYKFTIGRSSGTATLRLSQTTDAVWDTIGFVGTVDDPVGTGQAADEQRNHTSERWRVDLGSSTQCRAFHVISAADTEFPLSSSAVLTLKAGDVEAMLDPGGSPSLSQTLARESTGSFNYLDALADTTHRYWEFEFQDRLNPNGPQFALHQIYLGDYVTPISRNISNGFRRKLVDPARLQEADSGVIYSTQRPKYYVFENVRLSHLSGDDRTEIERIIQELGTTNSFFLSLDPLAEISDSVGEWTKYVRIVENDLEHFRTSKHFVTLSFREQVG